MKISGVLLKSLFIWKILFVTEDKESILIDSNFITNETNKNLELDFVFIEGEFEEDKLFIKKIEKLKEKEIFIKYEKENYLNENFSESNEDLDWNRTLYEFISIYDHIELTEGKYYEFKWFFRKELFFIKSANLITEVKKVFKWKINDNLNLELKNKKEIELDKLKTLEQYKNEFVEVQISFFSNNKFKINKIRLLDSNINKIKNLFYKIFIVTCFSLSLAFIFIDQIVLFYHSFSIQESYPVTTSIDNSEISKKDRFSLSNKKKDCKDLNLTTIYPFLYSSISLDRLAELDYTNNINCYFYENNLNKVNFEIDYKNIEKIISSDLDEIKLYEYLLDKHKLFKERTKSLSENNSFLENLTIKCWIEDLTNCSQLVWIINNFYPLKEVLLNIEDFNFEKNILRRDNNKIFIEELTNDTFSLLNYEKIKSIHLENLKEIYNIIQYNTRYDYLKDENKYIISIWPFYWSRELEYFILSKKINKDPLLVWRYLYLDKNNISDFILFQSNKKNIINNIKLNGEIKENIELLNFLTGLDSLNKVIINN